MNGLQEPGMPVIVCRKCGGKSRFEGDVKARPKSCPHCGAVFAPPTVAPASPPPPDAAPASSAARKPAPPAPAPAAPPIPLLGEKAALRQDEPRPRKPDSEDEPRPGKSDSEDEPRRKR